jgi:carbamate kinase
MKKLAVVAIGGNSLIRDKHHLQVEDQYRQIKKTDRHIADIIEAGYEVVITHGNGPQVGFIMRRSEIAYESHGIHMVPLVSCVADTQGAIGYQIQQAMSNEFQKRNIKKEAVTIVTQVKVSEDDPALANPTKPIGRFFSDDKIDQIRKDNPEWVMVNDAGRGYRRVVPSPYPLEIVEEATIRNLAEHGSCVIAVGGGGIPVIEKDGELTGVDAVIDKDFATALLALNLKAELLIISTGVDRVCLNFGKENEKKLAHITIDEADQYIKEGHFAAGSMLPKVKAILTFLKGGGTKAIITKPDNLKRSLTGKCGTHIA